MKSKIPYEDYEYDDEYYEPSFQKIKKKKPLKKKMKVKGKNPDPFKHNDGDWS